MRRGEVLYELAHPDFDKPPFAFREWAFVLTAIAALLVTCVLVPFWFWRKGRRTRQDLVSPS